VVVVVGYSHSAMSLLPCLLVLSSLQAPAIVAASAAAGGRPPAMFVFGDSTLDVGNNNYLAGPGVPQANKPYYGIDFPGSVPTGRFSNGYNIADYLGNKTIHFLHVFIFLYTRYIHACMDVQQRAWGSRLVLRHTCRWHLAPAVWSSQLVAAVSAMLPEELGSSTPL
jgi:hypothetical protein